MHMMHFWIDVKMKYLISMSPGVYIQVGDGIHKSWVIFSHFVNKRKFQ